MPDNNVQVKKRGKIIYNSKGQPIGRKEVDVQTGKTRVIIPKGQSGRTYEGLTPNETIRRNNQKVQIEKDGSVTEISEADAKRGYVEGSLVDYSRQTGSKVSYATARRSGAVIDVEGKTAKEVLTDARERVKKGSAILSYNKQKQRDIEIKQNLRRGKFEGNLSEYQEYTARKGQATAISADTAERAGLAVMRVGQGTTPQDFKRQRDEGMGKIGDKFFVQVQRYGYVNKPSQEPIPPSEAPTSMLTKAPQTPWYFKVKGKAETFFSDLVSKGKSRSFNELKANSSFDPKVLFSLYGTYRKVESYPSRKFGWSKNLQGFIQEQDKIAVQKGSLVASSFGEFKENVFNPPKSIIYGNNNKSNSNVSNDSSGGIFVHMKGNAIQVFNTYASGAKLAKNTASWGWTGIKFRFGQGLKIASERPATTAISIYGGYKLIQYGTSGIITATSWVAPNVAESPAYQTFVSRGVTGTVIGAPIAYSAYQEPTFEKKSRSVVGDLGIVAAFGAAGKAKDVFNTNIWAPLNQKFNPAYTDTFGGKPIELKPVHTDPISKNNLLDFAGTRQTVIHATDNPNFKFDKNNMVLLESDSQMASGFRKNADLLNFYRSLPTDKGNPQAYLAYMSDITPKDYRSQQLGFTFLKGKKQLLIENTDIRFFEPMKGENMFGYSQRVNQYAGQTMIPAENIFGASIERQVITPSKFTGISGTEYPGTILTKTKDLGFTYFKQGPGRTFKNPTLQKFNEIFNTKTYKIYLTETRTQIPIGYSPKQKGVSRKIDLEEYSSSYGNKRYLSSSDILKSSLRFRLFSSNRNPFSSSKVKSLSRSGSSSPWSSSFSSYSISDTYASGSLSGSYSFFSSSTSQSSRSRSSSFSLSYSSSSRSSRSMSSSKSQKPSYSYSSFFGKSSKKPFGLSSSKKSQSYASGFEVYVRRRGKEVRLGTGPVDYKTGLSALARELDTTASASGFLKKTNRRVKKGRRDNYYRSRANQFYTKIKGGIPFLIEKNVNRISTRGEIIQIPYASKRKNKGWFR